MKLTNKVKKQIEANHTIKALLCAELNASYHTVLRLLRENKDESKLTTVRAVRTIAQQLKMDEAEVVA